FGKDRPSGGARPPGPAARRSYRATMPQPPGDAEPRPDPVPPDGRDGDDGDNRSDGGDAARMPPWLPKAFVLAGAVVVAFQALTWLLQRLRDLLLLLLISLFLAFAIEPAVNWLARRGWRRGPATAVTFLVVGVLVAAFLGGIASVLFTQANNLVE